MSSTNYAKVPFSAYADVIDAIDQRYLYRTLTMKKNLNVATLVILFKCLLSKNSVTISKIVEKSLDGKTIENYVREYDETLESNLPLTKKEYDIARDLYLNLEEALPTSNDFYASYDDKTNPIDPELNLPEHVTKGRLMYRHDPSLMTKKRLPQKDLGYGEKDSKKTESYDEFESTKKFKDFPKSTGSKGKPPYDICIVDKRRVNNYLMKSFIKYIETNMKDEYRIVKNKGVSFIVIDVTTNDGTGDKDIDSIMSNLLKTPNEIKVFLVGANFKYSDFDKIIKTVKEKMGAKNLYRCNFGPAKEGKDDDTPVFDIPDKSSLLHEVERLVPDHSTGETRLETIKKETTSKATNDKAPYRICIMDDRLANDFIMDKFINYIATSLKTQYKVVGENGVTFRVIDASTGSGPNPIEYLKSAAKQSNVVIIWLVRVQSLNEPYSTNKIIESAGGEVNNFFAILWEETPGETRTYVKFHIMDEDDLFSAVRHLALNHSTGKTGLAKTSSFFAKKETSGSSDKKETSESSSKKESLKTENIKSLYVDTREERRKERIKKSLEELRKKLH